MSRAHLAVHILQSSAGAEAPVSGATVSVRQPGTTTLVTGTLYADDMSSTTLANPLTSASDGLVEFWMDYDQSVDLYCVSGSVTLTRRCEVLAPSYEASLVIEDATDVTKQVGWDVSTATTGTKTTIKAAQTVNRTLTLPDVTSTLAALGLAQNFTALQEFSGGISADGTYTLTLPAETGTLTSAAGAVANSVLTGTGTGTYAWSTSPTLTKIALDANAYLTLSGADPVLAMDSTDYVTYNRTNNLWEFVVGGAEILRIASTGVSGAGNALVVTNGLTVSAGGATIVGLGTFAAGDKYVIADASGHLHLSALGPAS